MKRIVFSGVLFFIILSYSFPLGVDVNEIKTGKEIQFINFTGKQPLSPAEAIKGIGITISRIILSGKTTGQYGNKYTIIHAFDPAVAEKFDADILIINKTAGVNHINSVRLIIAGYLENQYGYVQKDASTLAIFITIYNAVYRNNLDYFKSKYKEVVLKNLKAEIVGLSVNYADWPGGTQIVIPITGEARPNEINSLDTTALSDKTVIDSLKAQEDKGIQERKDLVEIKEKQLTDDKKDLEKAKTDLEKEKTDLAKEKTTLEEKKTELAKTDQNTKTPETEKLKEEIKTTEQKITNKEEVIKTKEDNVAKKEEKIAEKEKNITEEKKDIARDEKIVEVAKNPNKLAEELVKKEEDLKVREEEQKKAQTDKKVFAGKFYYLQVEEYLVGGHYNNALYILNANTGEVLVKSPVANISGRKYDIAPSQGVVVITHKGTGTENNYLSILDLDTLEAKYTSEDAVFHRSFVEVQGNNIFAVVIVNNTYYLGKYDLTLKRVAISKESVYEDSYITFYNDRVYINSRDNKILALKKDDLSLIEKITPG